MVTRHQDLSRVYKTALVTGASSGIGKAVSDLLGKSGIHVTGTSRFPDTQKAFGAIDWIHFDGSSKEGFKRFIEDNAILLSNIDILINNSGSALFGKETDIPEDLVKREHFLLVECPVKLTRQVLPHLLKRGRGAIVNISSLAALFRLPYMGHYSDCKAELSQFTQQVISDNGGSGVTVIDFQPGDYRTNFNRNMIRCKGDDSTSERVWKQMEKHLQNAPPPEQAGRDIVRALGRGQSGTIRSGSFFQRTVAPLGHSLLPESVINWAIRKYYRLP